MTTTAYTHFPNSDLWIESTHQKAQPTIKQIPAREEHTVIPELFFTDEQLNDPTPMTFTMRELYDTLVENGAVVQIDEVPVV